MQALHVVLGLLIPLLTFPVCYTRELVMSVGVTQPFSFFWLIVMQQGLTFTDIDQETLNAAPINNLVFSHETWSEKILCFILLALCAVSHKTVTSSHVPFSGEDDDSPTLLPLESGKDESV